MKIAICLVNVSIGGVWTCLRNIIERLETEERYSFSIIIKERVVGDDVNVDFLAKKNIPLTLVPKFEVPKPKSRIVRRIWKIRRWLHEVASSRKVKCLVKDADFIIDYLDGYFAEELKGLRKPKMFWFHQGAYVWEKRLAHRAHIVLPVFDRIVCLTEGFRKFFAEQYPQYDHKAVTLYNFLDFEAVRKRAQTAPRTAVAAPYFVFVGRLSKDKDHDTAIKAFAKFARQHKTVKLVLVGDGPRRNEIENLISSTGMKDRIILAGAIDNPYGYIKDSVAHILSTYGEGLPTVLLEAAALEVPNISADCLNGPDEILLNGEAGLLFRPGDDDMLAEHMSAIWTNRELREKLVKNASQSLNRFSAESVIPQLKSLLELR